MWFYSVAFLHDVVHDIVNLCMYMIASMFALELGSPHRLTDMDIPNWVMTKTMHARTQPAASTPASL